MTPSKDAPLSFIGIVKAYPWLGILLGLSVIVTLWAATRRGPAPEAIAPAIEPAVEVSAPAPAAEAEPEPTVWPDFSSPAPPPAPPAPAAVPAGDMNQPMIQTEDGAWKGPTLARPER